MPTRRSKKRAKKPGRPRNLGPLSPKPAEAPISPASLPLPGRGDEALSAPSTTLALTEACPRCGTRHSAGAKACGLCGLDLTPATVPAIKPHWWRPADSEIRKKALKIVLMRAAGMSEQEIASELQIGLKTIGTYMYQAGKNGWLESDLVPDPKDRLEFGLMHKVVRNIEEALNSVEESTRTGVALEIAKGTIFKTYDKQAVAQAPMMNMLSVKIEMPEGVVQKVREGTMGGKPAFVEGEIVGIKTEESRGVR